MKGQKNILIFTPHYYPFTGGLSSYLKSLLEEFSGKNELQISLVTSHTDETAESEENISANIKIYRLPSFNIVENYPFPKFWTKEFRQHWKKIQFIKTDITITNTRFFITSLFPFFLIQRGYWIHIEHGGSHVKDGSFFIRITAFLFDLILGRIIYSSCSKILCDSNAVREFVHSFGKHHEKTTVNWIGIKNDFWNSKNRNQYREIPVITYCGRLVRSKGVQDLITSLSGIQDLKWELHLIGDGNFRKNLEDIAEEFQISSRIIWHGARQKEYIRNVLLYTDIFINPSYTEGFPISLLEAGACGCTLIATSIQPHRELITHPEFGLLYSTNDRSALKDSIRLLLENPELRKKMSRSIQKRVIAHFDIKQHVKNIYGIIQDIS